MTNIAPISKSILIMAGGTGGHIFPGLAVAEYLRLEGWRVYWLGNPQGMEYNIITQKGITFESVQFGGLRGKGIMTKIMLPVNLMKASYQSLKIMRKIKPDVLLGMGGYITFPAGLVASLTGYPLVLHEQNSVAGLVNKVLSKFASRSLCAFPEALPHAEWVGNPLRADILQLPTPDERFANRSGNLKILVVGGSLGAQALNQIVPQAIALIPENQRPTITHQAGQKNLDELVGYYQDAKVTADFVPFIENMAKAYADADVVICRAGAMTVAELAACGVASYLVPFPYAVDDHQTSNAQFLSKDGAAVLMPQNELTPEKLSQWLMSIDRFQLLKMSNQALKKAKPFATVRVAEVCKEASAL
jgi:UDP-N-acetylglucosamine--N-acetylmuramyl-(pentapeptide) pyrophosphoryl-undecaprenol N-acetylglucosamine transferase